MLTKTSLEFIQHLLGSTDVKEHVPTPYLRKLFQRFHHQKQSYTIIPDNEHRKTGKYPESYFIAKRIMTKLRNCENIVFLRKITIYTS